MIIDHPKESDIIELKNLWKEAFNDTDETIDDFFNTAFSEKRCMCFKYDNNIAAALYWFDCSCTNKSVAYIYAVATAKAYRGKGICHTLMNHTHEYLKSMGYDGSVLVPGSKDLFEFYKKMGYSVCCGINEINVSASNNIINLRIIDKDEYTALRKKFIPTGGIIQENENIDYLATYASFYAGDNFLLAAIITDGKLYGAELLGDSSVAGDILCTLGCSTGKFRMVGNGKDFAMYYPLNNDAIVPSYFGLAFD